MKNYLDLLDAVMCGVVKADRTKTGTTSLFGRQLRFDLTKGFPVVTTRKIHLKSVIHELLWFLRGETNIAYLKENGVKIWDEWADENGELGPVYGKQWRGWRNFGAERVPTGPYEDWLNTQAPRAHYENQSIDQIADAVRKLRENPDDRRIIVSAWNVAELPDMKLPPCHLLFQFYSVIDPSTGRRRLSCQLYQRSADVFLDVPFNIASYALLTHMIAQVTNHDVGDFIHVFGDVHLYRNHLKQANIQLERHTYPLPRLELNPEITEIDDFRYRDINVTGYFCHPSIPAPIAVGSHEIGNE